jgi:hypothetical protein
MLTNIINNDNKTQKTSHRLFRMEVEMTWSFGQDSCSRCSLTIYGHRVKVMDALPIKVFTTAKQFDNLP